MSRVRSSTRKPAEQPVPVPPEATAEVASAVGAPLPLPQPGQPSTPPQHPSWQRPKHGAAYHKVAQILIHKAAGLRTAEIAAAMDTTENYIRHLLWLAGKNGWFTEQDLVDPSEQLAFDISHKVVRNISEALDGKELTQGQHDMTIKTAAGIGLFKNHSAIKNDQPMIMPVLSVRIEGGPVAGTTVTALPEGSEMGGVPAYAEEGEVVE